MNETKLERISPFMAGVAPDAIRKFTEQLKDDTVNMHGFLMLREGKVFAEGYYKPFAPDTPHRMYSVSKSLTSLAIGLLEEEGKLSLDDLITDYFPEKLPKEVHPYIREITIRHMLMMATAHKTATYKRFKGDDWVESFFKTVPTHHPGCIFSYDSSSSHTLAALAEKLSGTSLFAYLSDKVFQELGCSKEMKWLTDLKGICMGGSGFICTMEDLAKISYTIMNDGKFNGKQLLPSAYLKEATAKQIDTTAQPLVEERQGYGYQFWRTRYNGYAMFGVGGQLAIFLPDFDFILVTTADTQGDYAGVGNIYHALWQHIYPELVKGKEGSLRGIENYTGNLKFLSELAIKPLEGSYDFHELRHVNGMRFIMQENPIGLLWVKLSWHESLGILDYANQTGEHQLFFGIGGYEYQKFPGTDYGCMSSGAMMGNREIRIKSNVIDEEFGSVDMHFGFTEHGLSVRMRRASERVLKEYEGFAAGELC